MAALSRHLAAWSRFQSLSSINAKFSRTLIRPGGKYTVHDSKLRACDRIQTHTHSLFTHTNHAPVSFNSNLVNEVEAVKARILKPTPPVEPTTFAEFHKFVLSYLPKLFRHRIRKIEPVSIEEYISRTHATKTNKIAIKRAYDKLFEAGVIAQNPLSQINVQKWTKRKAFVKVENLLYNGLGGLLDKSPRLIQGATPEFIALVGPFIMALADRCKKIFNSNHCIWWTAGANSRETAMWLYADPSWLHRLNDVGAYDASYDDGLCDLELAFAQVFGCPIAAMQLMRENINTRGVTTNGVRYRRIGMRKSGDPYTSLFNSLMNGFMHLFAFFKSNPGIHIDVLMQNIKILVQGDDIYLAYNPLFHLDLKYVEQLGFKCDNVVLDDKQVADFCSCWCYPDALGHVFAPKIGRLMNKFGVFCEHPDQDPLAMARGTAISLETVCGELPIIRALVRRVLSLTEGKKPYFSKLDEPWKLSFQPLRVDSSTFQFIEHIYGLNHEMVDELEEAISHFSFGDRWEDLPYTDLLFERDTSAPNCFFNPIY
uniref:RNA-dependent RNA polymerase n=1 Tax=Riboviria sp. TaxID=2585031 RepID=A0A514D0D3_9VIRU|nr:MAG: RNA-dependent RNA polymerase [Riboviria sp.]